MRPDLSVNLSSLLTAGLLFIMVTRSAAAQDIDVVQVDNPPVWGDSPALVEELRIGAADGEMEYLFGSIAAVGCLPDGSILVADRQGPVIRRYTGEGEYVRDIGAPGNGPGEYNSILGMKVLPSAEIVVWDPRNRRLTFYSAEGDDLESHPVNSGTFSSDVLHVDENETSWVLATDIESGRLDNGNFRQNYILAERSGEISGEVPVPQDVDSPGFVVIGDEGVRRPFVPMRPHSVAREGRIILGDNVAYTLDFLEDDSPVRRLERSYTPIDVTDEEREQWDDVARRFEERSTEGRTFPDTPSVKPAFRRIKVDADGRLWVERYVEAVPREREDSDGRLRTEWKEPSVFDVMEPDGTFLGQVALPFGAYFHDARGMQVYAEFSGEDDVPYVIRYRIETD